MTNPRAAAFAEVLNVPGIPRDLWSDPGNILAFDNLLDAWGAGREGSHQLGQLSEQYETGGRGPGTVSSGKGDPGGVSYGSYQLATNAGTVAAFVKNEGAAWAALKQYTPGSTAFSATWKAIATAEPKRFAAAQHAFIERTHYRPVVNKVHAATGYDANLAHPAIQDVFWSMAVQHGKAADIIAGVVKDAALNGAALIRALYAARSAYVTSIANRNTGTTRQTLLNVVANRYPAEMADALGMLA